jgi:hypothetical protein
LSFGDLVTAWHSTGIPNIEMFVHVTGDAFPEGDLSMLPDGLSEEERAANRAKVVTEVTGANGSRCNQPGDAFRRRLCRLLRERAPTRKP